MTRHLTSSEGAFDCSVDWLKSCFFWHGYSFSVVIGVHQVIEECKNRTNSPSLLVEVKQCFEELCELLLQVPFEQDH
jgi:hypothetical protein